MTEHAAILPLALTMIAGPQIISAVVLATSGRPVRNSLAYLAGATIAVVGGTFGAILLAHALGGGPTSSGGESEFAKVAKYVLAGALALLIVRTFLTRGDSKPPKWMGSLQEAGPKLAFRLGFLILLLMPGDVVVMLSIGHYLAANDLGVLDSLPFVVLTLAILSLPLGSYVLLGAHAKRTMPGIRDWMNANAWLINIVVYAFFIVLLLG